MNRERISQLADIIEKAPHERFNMRNYECGTMLCIAGFAVHEWGSPETARLSLICGPDGWETQARGILDLTQEEAAGLFAGDFCGEKFLRNITKTEAVAELRRIAGGGAPTKRKRR